MTPEEANKILFGAVLVTKLEIRKAYKVLALIYHPDKVRRSFSRVRCALHR
jgi:preprotein translocase subunit Sec63